MKYSKVLRRRRPIPLKIREGRKEKKRKKKKANSQKQKPTDAMTATTLRPSKTCASGFPLRFYSHGFTIADSITHESVQCHARCALSCFVRTLEFYAGHGDVFPTVYSDPTGVHSWRGIADYIDWRGYV